MAKILSEIQIIPTKPDRGLIAFASFVIFDSLYCGSIAIYTQPKGGYKLLYPNKKIGDKDIDVFHPINRSIGKFIEQEVIKKLEDVMNNDRHSCTDNYLSTCNDS